MFVGLLREDHGLSIRTDEYHADNKGKGGFGVYGIYTLTDQLVVVKGGDA
ncbi:MAG: hypothetical protein AB3N13_00205 [Arenibacterium sp.]